MIELAVSGIAAWFPSERYYLMQQYGLLVSVTWRTELAIDDLDQLRERFIDTLKLDVRSLIRLHERDANSVGRPGEWLRAIRRASVVLIGANLENFIEELVCSALSHLTDQGVMARRFPEGYRLWRFRYTAQSKMLGVDDAKELVALDVCCVD